MFGPLSPLEISRLEVLPRIRRARDYHLYGADGSRWLDCWCDGGRALLGHRPPGLSHRLKTEIEKGLYAPYPSPWEARLGKALLRCFPEYSQVRVFQSLQTAMDALEMDSSPVDPLDLPTQQTDGDYKNLWGRLYLPKHPAAPRLFPILPLPGMSTVQPVLFRDFVDPPPPTEPVSPVLLAALARVVANFEHGNLPIYSISSDIWERRGPYMLFHGDNELYLKFFWRLAAQRILIAPSRHRPSICPPEMSSKESAMLFSLGDLD